MCTHAIQRHVARNSVLITMEWDILSVACSTGVRVPSDLLFNYTLVVARSPLYSYNLLHLMFTGGTSFVPRRCSLSAPDVYSDNKCWS